MKGLIYKEFRVNISQLVILLLSFIFIIGIYSTLDILLPTEGEEVYEGISTMSYVAMFFIPFCATSILSTSYQVDEKSHWFQFILGTGVKRNAVIYSKLIYVLICFFAEVVIFFFFYFLPFDKEINVNEIVSLFFTFLSSGVVTIGWGLLLNSLLGGIIGQLVIVFTEFIFISLTIVPYYFGNIAQEIVNLPIVFINNSWLFSFVGFIIFLIISVLLIFGTIKVFKKKEF